MRSFSFPLRLSLLGKNDFGFKKDINGKEFEIKITSYKKDEKNAPATLSIEAGFANEKSKSAKLKGGAGYDLEPSILSFDGQEAKFYFSSDAINLPFTLRLDKFILERYAGLNSPSSYTSKVSIADAEHEISLNHPLSIMGYKIFNHHTTLTSLEAPLRSALILAKRQLISDIFCFALALWEIYLAKKADFLDFVTL
ncbi:cytochrome c biogenesis protein ResB [Campylobacter concisus]